jgi:hypothetical protein
MSKRVVLGIVLLLAVACLLSAGCKKKSDNPIIIIQPDVGGTHYYGVDMYGDLLNAQINEASEVYSWLQLAGPTPIGVGQGALTPASGLSTYAYYDADPDDDTMWALNPGKFAALGGDGFAMLCVPVVSSQYNAASIAGMYNILSMDLDPDDGSVTSDYGTLEITAAGAWKIWWNIDGTAEPLLSDDEGTWTDNGNGLVTVFSAGLGGNIGNIAFYPSANGNILVMNYGVFHPMFGAAYGMIVGLPQVSVASGDFDGTYDAIESDEIAFDQITVSGATVSTGGGPITLTFDSPWTGMMETDGGEYVLATKDGLIIVVTDNGGVSDDDMILAVEEQ